MGLGQADLIARLVCHKIDTDRDLAASSNETSLASADASPTDIPGLEEEPERPTQSRLLKPHPEATTDGFDTVPPIITSLGRDNPQPTAPPDVGSVIESYLTRSASDAIAVPSIHTERSESGWEVVPTSRPRVTPTPAAGPHWEQSTNGFGPPATPQVPGAPGPVTEFNTRYSPRPTVQPPPVVTQGPITFTPVPVTSVRITTVDGKPTTLASTVNWQYVVGTATVPVNSPTMINNVPVAISIDASGNTVFVAGSQSTTLPPSPQAQGISISTTVIDGTTKYIIAGQTLAPNQAITVGDVPISIGANGRSTVLVMGDLTTTFSATTTTISGTIGPGASASATGARSAAASAHTRSLVLAKILAIAALVRPFL